jgi:dipeptidyl aminopeptidase/acylaminoacyl peptidase
VVVRPAANIPAAWDRYSQHLFRDVYLPGARQKPEEPSFVRQYFIIDVTQAKAWPLWNAPNNFGKVAWSPNGRKLLIAPTFVPAELADDSGLEGNAAAVVDIASASFERLPLAADVTASLFQLDTEHLFSVRWSEDGTIDLMFRTSKAEDQKALTYRRVNGRWQSVDTVRMVSRSPRQIRVELKESPDSPPALYAVDTANGLTRLIMDLNPQLRHLTLGKVEAIHWRGRDGREWTGMLYYPVHFRPGSSFPLVIQTHGYSLQRFLPDGGYTTLFAAQELANRDIAVLQVGGSDVGGMDIVSTVQEAPVFMAGLEGAIDHLVAEGIADRERIGVVGFSRTGWLVEYMITQSLVPLAAAEVADNVDGSYFQYVLGSSALRVFFETGNGGRPIGSGLLTWAKTAPGFNADRVRCPLRMEIDSETIDQVLTAWEMFSNLRYLHKPVELSVIPDIEHGTHVLQNPKQRMASQTGTVDWFCFWLKGEEDPDGSKSAQYARWRKLRELQLTSNSN